MVSRIREAAKRLWDFKNRNCIALNTISFVGAIFRFKITDHDQMMEGVGKSYVVKDQSERICRTVDLLQLEMSRIHPKRKENRFDRDVDSNSNSNSNTSNGNNGRHERGRESESRERGAVDFRGR